MKPILNLFFDFEFTCLSPDAQPISLGIVSSLRERIEPIGGIHGYESKMIEIESKTFYAEFSDFDINRCNDWVKENVVSKLGNIQPITNGEWITGKTNEISLHLKSWLSQFTNYDIQFVCDCGTFDWYWMLQLIGEWDQERKCYDKCIDGNASIPDYWSVGLPKLPSNISPVPFDLNDLIAIKYGISVREAFELNREELSFKEKSEFELLDISLTEYKQFGGKHNTLWDSFVIKSIYNKLR